MYKSPHRAFDAIIDKTQLLFSKKLYNWRRTKLGLMIRNNNFEELLEYLAKRG